MNDLATTRPDLAKEWDYEKNEKLPTGVTRGARAEVWWKCARGHSWIARISARDYENDCPYCSNISKTSLPEQIIYFYVKKYFPDALNMYSINGISFDIFVPSAKVVIEYDGSEWHRDKDTNYKFDVANELGLKLYKKSGVLTDTHENVYVFDDTNLRMTNSNNKLMPVLRQFLLDVFGIIEDFSDYTDAFVFARKQKFGSKSKALQLPSGGRV